MFYISITYKYGVPGNRIIYTGFPIHEKFTGNQVTQRQLRTELNIELDQFTMLMTGGGGNMRECNAKTIAVQRSTAGLFLEFCASSSNIIHHLMVPAM